MRVALLVLHPVLPELRCGLTALVLVTTLWWQPVAAQTDSTQARVDSSRARADSTRAPADSARRAPTRPWRSMAELGAEQRLADSLRAERIRAQRDTIYKQWPIPGRATRLSLLVPGLGQIYNAGWGRPNVSTVSKWWHTAKVPVIYGLMGFTIYLAIQNDNRYQFFRQAYIDRVYNESLPDSLRGLMARFEPFPNASTRGIQNARDLTRRSRDQAIFWTVVVYALNGIEAYVSAHLRTFDVSDNLSLRVTPTIDLRPPSAFNPEPGLNIGARLSLSFGR